MTGIAFGSGGGGGGNLPLLTVPATAAHILLGKEAIDGKGNKITGTMQAKSAQTYTPGSSSQVIAAGQYLSGDQTISAVLTQEKTVTPSMSAQSVYPDAGKYLSRVTVQGMEIKTVSATVQPTNSRVLDLEGFGCTPQAIFFLLDDDWDSMENNELVMAGYFVRRPGSSSGYSRGYVLYAMSSWEDTGVYSGRLTAANPNGWTVSWSDEGFSLEEPEGLFDDTRAYTVLICGFDKEE